MKILTVLAVSRHLSVGASSLLPPVTIFCITFENLLYCVYS